MHISTRLAMALTLIGLAAPVAATAQSNTPKSGMSLGLTAGATMPVGDYADISKTGWNTGVFLDFGRLRGPIGLRADFLYSGFGDKDLVTSGSGTTAVTFSNKYSIVSGTLDLVIGLPMDASPVRPYLIGGGGAYYVKNSQKCNGLTCALGLFDTDNSSNTKFGLNGGAGIEFGMGGSTGFVEARFHNIFEAVPKSSCFGQSGCARTAAQLLPLNFGIKLNF